MRYIFVQRQRIVTVMAQAIELLTRQCLRLARHHANENNNQKKLNKKKKKSKDKKMNLVRDSNLARDSNLTRAMSKLGPTHFRTL